jgi:ATP-dependent metalloprotease
VISFSMHAVYANSTIDGGSRMGIPALTSVGQLAKDGVLGTSSAPIHMVTSEAGHFKEQLWKTFRVTALTFLVIPGIGALIEGGIIKGLLLWNIIALSWS